MKQSIAVIDYGMGNLRSVAKALEHVAPNADVLITSNKTDIQNADRVVFPGQGAAEHCMQSLAEYGLVDSVKECANTKPFLGICMGMQILMSHSAENSGVDCLGVFEGDVLPFARAFEGRSECEALKIPQMGWNGVKQTDHPLWHGIKNGDRFYFVHSYYVQPADQDLIVGECEYGIDYAAALARDNVFAIQCHPEKSADAGLKLLSNFVSA